MKTHKILMMLFLALTLFACKKEDDDNPAKVALIFTGERDWNFVKNGEYLRVNVEVDFDNSSAELKVETVECFLGNRKIASANGSKCEVCYKIKNAPIGIHEFRAEAFVTAPNFDKTLAAGYYEINVEN